MSTSRSKLNMTDFLANLTTSPTTTEPKDDFSQLDMFANTDFFNFDLNEALPANPQSAADGLQSSWTNLTSPDVLNSKPPLFCPLLLLSYFTYPHLL
jgi:hypothetical protein